MRLSGIRRVSPAFLPLCAPPALALLLALSPLLLSPAASGSPPGPANGSANGSAGGSGVEKFPEPSLYPVAPELSFRYRVPKRIVVDVPREPHPRAYWYMTYTVTNNGDEPFEFLPLFEMLTEEGQVVRSDRAIPQEVFEAVKRRAGLRFLESARQIEGSIQTGEDQARDGVAIWPEPMQRMGTFSVFVSGLSQEAVQMKDESGKPMTNKDAKTGEERPVILHKTLQLTFRVLGDNVRPGNDPIVFEGSKWVMR